MLCITHAIDDKLLLSYDKDFEENCQMLVNLDKRWQLILKEKGVGGGRAMELHGMAGVVGNEKKRWVDEGGMLQAVTTMAPPQLLVLKTPS